MYGYIPVDLQPPILRCPQWSP